MQRRFAIRFALFALGFLSIATQIIMIREFLNIFYGNELVMGIVLANWMLLTGLGARFGNVFHRIQRKIGFLVFLMVLMTILPSFMILNINLLKTLFFPFGSMIGLWGVICSSFLVLLPFCLINGFLFTSLSVLNVGQSKAGSLGMAYSLESLGSLFSALFVSLVLLWYFDAGQIAWVVTLAFILSVIIFSEIFLNLLPFIILTLFLLALSVGLRLFDMASVIRELRFPHQQVVADQNTPYGHLTVTKNEGQLNYFENGVLLFSSGNVINSEESVHFAMIQHKKPEKILLISGGISGSIPEVMKYKPSLVDYVELNPSLIEIARKLKQIPLDSVIHLFSMDAYKFVKSTGRKYDIVIIDLPEPSTLQINRYYTYDFFVLAKRRMNPDGVIGLSLPASGDYLSEKAGKLNATLYNSLKMIFSNVLILPSEKNYFLASNASLSINIPGLIVSKGISTVYVNQYYFDREQMQERSAMIMRNLDRGIPLNRDFHPVAAFYQMDIWLTYFKANFWWVGVLTGGLLFLFFLSLNPVSTGLFSCGFTLAATEVLILFAVQVSFGFVFQLAGMIIMIFMGGMSLGAWMMSGIFARSKPVYYLRIQVLLAFFSLLLPFILFWTCKADIPDWISLSILAVLSLIVSLITGFQYSLASGLSDADPGRTVSRNYAADLFGSACGAVAVSVYFFPLLGLVNTGLVLALLNSLSALILILRRKKNVSLG